MMKMKLFDKSTKKTTFLAKWSYISLISFSMSLFPVQSAVITTVWTGGSGSWSIGSNWITGTVPDNNATDQFVVIIDGDPGTSSTVLANVDADIFDLTLETGDTLNINSTAIQLALIDSGSGVTFLNNGTTNLNGGDLEFEGNATLTGTGALNISNGSSGLQRKSGSTVASTLTIDQDIVSTSGGTLGGDGLSLILNSGRQVSVSSGTMAINTIDAGSLTNNGTFLATTGGRLFFQDNPNLINNGTIEADSSGIIEFLSGTVVDNTNGLIDLDAGTSRLDIASSTINGGTINAGNELEFSGNGIINDADITIGTLLDVNGLNNRIDVSSSGSLTLGAGSLIDIATSAELEFLGSNITLDQMLLSGGDLQLGEDTTLTANNAGSEILFTSNASDISAIFGTPGAPRLTLDVDVRSTTGGRIGSDSLAVTLAAGRTITAQSGIDLTINGDDAPDDGLAAFINNGTLFANGGDINLTDNPTAINNGQINADSSGNILINTTVLDNSTGTITLAAGTSTLDLSSSTINGGTVTANNELELSGNSIINGANVFIGSLLDVFGANNRIDVGTVGTLDYGSGAELRLNSGAELEYFGTGFVIDQMNLSGGDFQIDRDTTLTAETASSEILISSNASDIDILQGSPDSPRLTLDIDVRSTNGGRIGGDDLAITLAAGRTITAESASDLIIDAADAPDDGNDAFINLGTITTNNVGELSIRDTATFNNNSGQITVAAGGLIEVTNSTTITGGNIDVNRDITNGFGEFQLENSSTLNNVATTVDGVFRATSGTITGGSLDVNSDGVLILNNFGSLTLDLPALTVDGAFSITGTSTTNLNIASNVEFNGNGAATFTGNGFNIIGSGALTNRIDLTTQGDLQAEFINAADGTLTVDGGTLRIADNFTNLGDFAIDGQLVDFNASSGVSSGIITISNGGKFQLDGGDLTGGGDLLITGTNSELEINSTNTAVVGDLTLVGDTILDINSGTTLEIEGDFTFDGTNESLFQVDGTILLSGADQTFEIGDEDFGTDPSNNIGDPAGFANNLFDTIELAENTTITLTDLIDNGNRNGSFGASEALYLDTLILNTGALLITNGLNVYFNNLVGDQSQIVSAPISAPTGIGVMLLSLAFAAMRRRK